jgi:hypothetical protein
MEINIKTLAGVTAIVVLASFMVGRYTVPTKTITKTVVQTVTVTAEDKQVDKQQDKDETITETDKPDGTKVTVTQITSKTDTESNDVKNTQTNTLAKSETITTNETTNWNVAVLFTPKYDSSNSLELGVNYGAMVERKIIGPFYLGAFGLENQNGFKTGGTHILPGLAIGGSF